MLYRNYRRTSATLALMFATTVCGFMTLSFAQDDAEPAKPMAAKPVEPSADLPEAEKLFEKAIDAMGGKKAFEELKSIHVVANVNMEQSPEPLKFEFWRAGEDKMILTQTFPAALTGMGEMTLKMGGNGDIWYIHNPMMGYQVGGEEMRDQVADQTMVVRHDLVNYMKSKAKSVKTTGQSTYMDEDCWNVTVTDENNETSTLYFSKKTGRLLGMTASKQSPMGETDVAMRLLDYKEFEPFTLYTKMEVDQGPQKITVNYDTIEINKVDPKTFELPDEVKAQAAENKDTPEPGKTPPGGGDVPHDHDGDGKPDH